MTANTVISGENAHMMTMGTDKVCFASFGYNSYAKISINQFTDSEVCKVGNVLIFSIPSFI